MKNNVKRNVIISVITICLLLLLLTGSTYALFSSHAEVSMVVSSAKVEVEAELTGIETYSMDVQQAQGKFELGGTAEINPTSGALELINVAPGDEVRFNVSITNNSTITILQRVRIANNDSEISKLLEVLEITIAGQAYAFNVNGELCMKSVENGQVTLAALDDTTWSTVLGGADSEVAVSILLPRTVGNDYQNKTCNLQVIVEAYQGNATELNPLA